MQTANESGPSHSKLMAVANATADGLRSLAVAVDSGQARDVGGAVCWYSASHVPLFNGAGLFEDHLLSLDTLEAIDAYFTARQRPYSLVTIDDLVPDAAMRLGDLNYIELDATPAMWLDNNPHNAELSAANKAVWVCHVQSLEELYAFRTILGSVFSIARSEVELILGPRILDVPHVRHYLGWIDGEPVATITLVLAGAVAGIWNVGTLPSHRRKGAAAQLMRRAISDAAAMGYKSTMLLSSVDGYPLYQRLGYETLSTVRMFVPPRQAL